MTKTSNCRILILLGFFIPTILFSQVNATFGSKEFGACELREAQVSSESVSVRLFEKNLEDPGSVGAEGILTETLGIIISANLPQGFKFPVEPRDSLILDYTNIQKNLDENSHFETQLNDMDMSRISSDAESLNSEKLTAEEESRIISEKLISGEISPEEAMAQMEKISDRVMKEVNGAYATNIEFEEFEERASFSITFYDTYNLEEANSFSGRLYIKKFNEKEFIAEIQGEFYTECLEGRSTQSAEAKEECRGVISEYLPQTRLLREGSITALVRFSIDQFKDNR